MNNKRSLSLCLATVSMGILVWNAAGLADNSSPEPQSSSQRDPAAPRPLAVPNQQADNQISEKQQPVPLPQAVETPDTASAVPSELELEQVPPLLAQHLPQFLQEAEGLVVLSLPQVMPGPTARLKPGDILLRVDGQPVNVEQPPELSRAERLHVIRSGKPLLIAEPVPQAPGIAEPIETAGVVQCNIVLGDQAVGLQLLDGRGTMTIQQSGSPGQVVSIETRAELDAAVANLSPAMRKAVTAALTQTRGPNATLPTLPVVNLPKAFGDDELQRIMEHWHDSQTQLRGRIHD